MPSTGRQKAEARETGEMDMLSDFENMDVSLSSDNGIPIDKELADTINSSINHNDTEALTQQRGSSSQEIEIRDIGDEKTILDKIGYLNLWNSFQTRLIGSLLQEMDSLMYVMHSQINRAMKSAINDRVIPEIQSTVGSLSTGHQDTGSGTSSNGQECCVQTSGSKTKITKEGSRSAFNLRDIGDLSPYTKIELDSYSDHTPMLMAQI